MNKPFRRWRIASSDLAIIHAGMVQENFYNDGFGWICRACERELAAVGETDEISRLMREGESESKQPEMSNRALAKWADAARTILECPRCGVTETADVR